MRKESALLSLLLLSSAGTGYCETMTLDTYYPSPAGIYTNVTVTSSTVLARDGGAVTVGSPGRPAVLSVSGVVIPGKFSADPDDSAQKVDGAIYYNTTLKKHRMFKDGVWTDFEAKSDWGCHTFNWGSVSAMGWGTISDGKFTGNIYRSFTYNTTGCAGIFSTRTTTKQTTTVTDTVIELPVTNPARCSPRGPSTDFISPKPPPPPDCGGTRKVVHNDGEGNLWTE